MTTVALDTFSAYTPNLSSPAYDVIVATKDDVNDLAKVSRFIRSEGAGNIQVTTLAGSTVILRFAAGETRAIRATRIWSTNTTAVGQIEVMI